MRSGTAPCGLRYAVRRGGSAVGYCALSLRCGTRDEADKAYTDKTYNTLVSYTVSAGTWSYKLLIEAETDTVYYIRKHKVNAKNAPGFLAEDLKRISRKR